MRLLKNDLLEVFDAALEKQLDKMKLEWQNGAAACVVLASHGYPAEYQAGFEISGLYSDSKDLVIFQAGTKAVGKKTVTAGGRVLGITAAGEDLASALKSAYAEAEKINFSGKYFRKDIGFSYLDKL